MLAGLRAGDLDTVPATLQLEFSHPAFADRDQRIALTVAPPDEAGNPVWSGHFVRVPDGRWYVALASNDEWRIGGEWRGERQLTLRPTATADVDQR